MSSVRVVDIASEVSSLPPSGPGLGKFRVLAVLHFFQVVTVDLLH